MMVSRKTAKKSESKAIKLSPHYFHRRAFAHSAGVLSVIAIIFYALFVWFGTDDGINVASAFPIGFSFNDLTFLFGVVQAYVLWYVAAWIFATIYNRSIFGR